MTINHRFLLALIALAWLATPAHATLYTWSPDTHDVDSLRNDRLYTWGISNRDHQAQSLFDELKTGNMEITGATLTFNNLDTNHPGNGDHLYVHLFTDVSSGVDSSNDFNRDADSFSGLSPLVGDWSSPSNLPRNGTDLVFNLNQGDLFQTLQDYILSRNQHSFFGFGIDPDAKYSTDGMTFQLNTSPVSTDPVRVDPVVPEPASVALLGIGLAGLGLVRRKRPVPTK